MVESQLSDRTNRLIQKAINLGLEEAKNCQGDFFSPILMAHTGKSIEVHRMQSSDPNDASRETNQILQKGDYFAYALIIDSTLTCSGERFDSVCVEACDETSDTGIKVHQRYIKTPEFEAHESPVVTAKPANRLLVSDDDQSGQEMVLKSPYAVLMIVAGADGTIEEHELKAFKKCMTRFIEKSDSEFINTIAKASLVSITEYAAEVFNPAFQSEAVISNAVRYIDQTMSPLQVSEFRLYLDAIAKEIAVAKKGIFSLGGKDKSLELNAVKGISDIMNNSLRT